jgi:hypothetical protein
MGKGLKELGKVTMLGVCYHNIETNSGVKTRENIHELST